MGIKCKASGCENDVEYPGAFDSGSELCNECFGLHHDILKELAESQEDR